MLQQLDHSIITELEDAVRSGSSEKRVATLRQVTDLFLHDGGRLNDDQIKVFDDVLCLLIARVESKARAELGRRLAPIDYAPFEVIQHLARDEEIAVAGSVLAQSSRLRTSDLVEIASTRGQEHLLAISGRMNLPEAVTDVIVDRGERKVIRKLANNASARFSDAGYSGIVARAEADDELTEILGLRIDLPLKFLRDLLRGATDAVRARLAAIAPAELQEEIKRVLKSVAGAAGEDASSERDFSRAEALVKLLNEHNELDDAAIIKFAGARKIEEVAASLAVLNNVATAMMVRLLEGPRSDLILIPCKSAGLSWLAVETILSKRPLQQPIPEQTLQLARKDYGKLSRRPPSAPCGSGRSITRSRSRFRGRRRGSWPLFRPALWSPRSDWAQRALGGTQPTREATHPRSHRHHGRSRRSTMCLRSQLLVSAARSTLRCDRACDENMDEAPALSI